MVFIIPKAKEILPTYHPIYLLFSKENDGEAAAAASKNYKFYQKIVTSCIGLLILITFVMFFCLLQANTSRINYYNKNFYKSSGLPIQEAFKIHRKIKTSETSLQELYSYEYEWQTPEMREYISKTNTSLIVDLVGYYLFCNTTKQSYEETFTTKVMKLNQSQRQIYKQVIRPYIAATLLITAAIIFCYLKQRKFILVQTELIKDISSFVKIFCLMAIMYCAILYSQYESNPISIKDIPLLCGSPSDTSVKYLTEKCYKGTETCYSIWHTSYFTALDDLDFFNLAVLSVSICTFLTLFKCLNELK